MKALFYASVLLLTISTTVLGQQTTSLDGIQYRFTNISDTVQTSIYWYWINGHLSKEGVVKDLEAMKKVGINRAFIGNIGLDGDPYGSVKLFSEEWWDILHTTLSTATRLGIQIGIFNGPGWSQSGGPWIKPRESMRYLTSSQVMVKGPLDVNKKLEKPQPFFQDVKVLAYPVAAGYGADISALKPVLSSEPVVDSLSKVMDQDLSTGIPLAGGKQFVLNIDSRKPYTLRGVILTITKQEVRLEGDIQAEINNQFVTLRHFVIDRSNGALNVGFTPWGAAGLSVPATTSGHFRILFSKVSSNSGLAEVKLSSTPVVEDFTEKTLAKMWPTPHPFWDAYQWAPQPVETSAYIIDPLKVVDISKYMDTAGNLHWHVPTGQWIIERTGMTSTNVSNSPAPPEGRGLEVDKMNEAHVQDHFNAFIGEILKRIPAEDRKSFKVVVEDSYETGGQNWTDNLITEFKEAYRYDPTPYLPVVQGKVVGSEDMTDRFLWDLRRLIANDVSFKYVGGLRKISHQYGLSTWLENYGHWGYPGEFLQYGGQSDEIGGEFWSEGDLGDIENRAASSSAHIYGKTKVSAESFTAAGNAFARRPALFKQRGDRFFTEGINNTLLHVYIEQPQDSILPGMTAFFGVEFNRLNTWFFDMDILLQYLKRCNMLLQQGHYIADAAYFIGEDAPKMTGVTDPALPKGYSFDYINADVIKERLTVNDGKLVLPNGTSYSILVLPKLKTMRPELLARLKELVQQGAVILGPAPDRSPSLAGYPEADRQVKAIAAELWKNNDADSHSTNSGPAFSNDTSHPSTHRPGSTSSVTKVGKGLVLSGMSMQEAFDLIKAGPDLKITGSDSILFIHRQTEDGSFYFISNQKKTPVSFVGNFRVTGRRPELWNPIDGSARDLPSYEDNGTTTSVPMQLAPLESAFIVFHKTGEKSNKTSSNYPIVSSTIPINQPWVVQFDPAMRGPFRPVVFDSLTDWSKNVNDSIKFYSGTAFYRNTFNIGSIKDGRHYVIDLGDARAIAKVIINGVEVGGAWTPPYQVDISRAVKQGLNQLTVKVVNTWVNRLIGDSKLRAAGAVGSGVGLPAGMRPTSVLYGPDPRGPLETSGLLGPVSIREEMY